MIEYPQISPYIFELGVIKPTWYGLMYVVGFVLGYALAQYRAKKSANWDREEVSNLLTFIMFGVILGGRIGYVLFYGLAFWAHDIWYPLRITNGGMSFHGGLLGVIIACLLFARKYQKSLLTVSDFIAPLVPVGLFFGRFGNFINGELWGRVTDAPWAMVFPTGGPLPRHPSQLYEMALEGLLLFMILWLYSTKPRAMGRVSGLFLMGYGVFRSLVELVREPDAHLNFIAFNWLTMGQLLSLPMILAGLYLLLRRVDG
ncbi:MAG: prolipoprotein diacylglyceryl transferase [Cardiobacteriales bacterium]|nr:MAG: prolipoprotein diacylglyceryl transferase [Cardiobacteriales bacterium]